jgi:hypothetical protein
LAFITLDHVIDFSFKPESLSHLDLLAFARQATTSRLPMRLLAHKASAFASHIDVASVAQVCKIIIAVVSYAKLYTCRPPVLYLGPRRKGLGTPTAAVSEILQRSRYVITKQRPLVHIHVSENDQDSQSYQHER